MNCESVNMVNEDLSKIDTSIKYNSPIPKA